MVFRSFLDKLKGGRRKGGSKAAIGDMMQKELDELERQEMARLGLFQDAFDQADNSLAAKLARGKTKKKNNDNCIRGLWRW